MTRTQNEEERVEVSDLSGVDGRRLEQMYVYDAYDQIAPYFTNIQHKAWPHVRQFLKEMDRGSIVADIGCGNGRYLGINSNVYMLGSDRCRGMVDIANKRHFETAVADNLCIPYRDGVFDGAISVAVIHHFVTVERRVQAIRELARIVQPGGKLMIYVWAFEQKYRKFESADVLVPWFHQLRSKNPSVEKKGRRGRLGVNPDNSGHHDGELCRRRSSRSSGKSSSQRRKSSKKLTGDSSTSSSSGQSKNCSLDKHNAQKCELLKGTSDRRATRSFVGHDNYAHETSMQSGIDSPAPPLGDLDHRAAIDQQCLIPPSNQAIIGVDLNRANALTSRGFISPCVPSSFDHSNIVIADCKTSPRNPVIAKSDQTTAVSTKPVSSNQSDRADIVTSSMQHESGHKKDDPVWVLRDEATSNCTSLSRPTLNHGTISRRPSSLTLDVGFSFHESHVKREDKRTTCLQRCADCICTSTCSPPDGIRSLADYNEDPHELVVMETSLGSCQLDEEARKGGDADDDMLSKPAFAAGIKDTLLTWFGKKSRTLDSGSSVNENTGSCQELHRSLSWKEYYHRFLRDNSSPYANVSSGDASMVEASSNLQGREGQTAAEFAVREFPLSSCPREWMNNMTRDSVGAVASNNRVNSPDAASEIDDTTSPLLRKFSSIKSTCNRVQNSLRSSSKMSVNSDKSSNYKGPYYHVLEGHQRTSSESDSYQYTNTGASLFDGFVYNCSTSNSTSYDDSSNFPLKSHTNESDSSGSAPKFTPVNNLNKSLCKTPGYAEAKIVDFNAVKSVNLANDGNHLLNVRRNKNGYHKLTTIQDEQLQEASKIAHVNPSFKFSDGKNPCAYEEKKINSRFSGDVTDVQLLQDATRQLEVCDAKRDVVGSTNRDESISDANIYDGRKYLCNADVDLKRRCDHVVIADAGDSFKTSLPLSVSGFDSHVKRESDVQSGGHYPVGVESSLDLSRHPATTSLSKDSSGAGESSSAASDGVAKYTASGASTDASTDVLNNATSSALHAANSSNTSDSRGPKSVSCQRYYHVFKEGELKQLIEDHVPSLHILKTFYDHANWCIVAEKVRTWKV